MLAASDKLCHLPGAHGSGKELRLPSTALGRTVITDPRQKGLEASTHNTYLDNTVAAVASEVLAPAWQTPKDLRAPLFNKGCPLPVLQSEVGKKLMGWKWVKPGSAVIMPSWRPVFSTGQASTKSAAGVTTHAFTAKPDSALVSSEGIIASGPQMYAVAVRLCMQAV